MSGLASVTATPWEGRLTLAVQRRRQTQIFATKLAEFSREASQPLPTTGATAGGDPQRLRGIPAVGGVSGTIRGTEPLGALLALEARGLLNLVRDLDGTSPGTQPEEALLEAEAETERLTHLRAGV